MKILHLTAVSSACLFCAYLSFPLKPWSRIATVFAAGTALRSRPTSLCHSMALASTNRQVENGFLTVLGSHLLGTFREFGTFCQEPPLQHHLVLDITGDTAGGGHLQRH